MRERDGRAVAAIIAAFRRLPSFGCGCGCGASVVMQRLSYPTETVLSKKITRNRIVLSLKESPRKPCRRRPKVRICVLRTWKGRCYALRQSRRFLQWMGGCGRVCGTAGNVQSIRVRLSGRTANERPSVPHWTDIRAHVNVRLPSVRP